MLLLISGYISWYKIWIQFFFWCISMPICWKSSYSCLDIVLPPLPVLSYLRDLDESCNLYAKNMLICTVNLWFAFLGDMILGPVWDHFPLRVLCLDWNWREDWGAQCMFSKFRWPDYWWRSWWTPKGCRPSAGIVIIIFWLGKGEGLEPTSLSSGLLYSPLRQMLTYNCLKYTIDVKKILDHTIYYLGFNHLFCMKANEK